MTNATVSTLGTGPIRLALAGVLLILASCGPGPSQEALPPIPQPGLEESTPLVRAQVERALEAVFEHPIRAEDNARLAMTLHAYLFYDAAQSAYHRTRLLAPREARWAYLHGKVLERLGRTDLAREAFQTAVTLDDGYLPARLALGRTLDVEGDNQEARRILEAAVKDEPNSAAARYELALALSNASEHAAAVTQLERALELAGPFDSGFYALANAYRALGRSDEAAAALENYSRHRGTSMNRIDPHMAAVQALDESATALIARARERYAGGRVEEAIGLLNKAVSNDAQDAVAHATLLALYAEQGQFEKVDQHYQAALRIDPDLAELHYNLGLARTLEKRNVEAVAAFRKALEIDPHSPDTHTRIGLVYASQKRESDALQAFRDALTIAPNYAPARRLLAEAHYDARRYEEAGQELEQLAALPGERTPDALRRLARCYRETGRAHDAVATLGEALELANRNAEGRLAASIERELNRSMKQLSDEGGEDP